MDQVHQFIHQHVHPSCPSTHLSLMHTLSPVVHFYRQSLIDLPKKGFRGSALERTKCCQIKGPRCDRGPNLQTLSANLSYQEVNVFKSAARNFSVGVASVTKHLAESSRGFRKSHLSITMLVNTLHRQAGASPSEKRHHAEMIWWENYIKLN